jgi:hypothetical protein
MRVLLRCSVLLMLSSMYVNTSKAEDAAAFLNKALSGKPAVQRERTVMVRKQRCRTYRIPNIANGGAWTECEDADVPEVQRFLDAARVTSTQVTLVRGLTFDERRVTQLPHHPLLFRMTYKNCADGTTLTNNLTLSVTGTKSLAVTKTKTVTTTLGVTTAFKGEMKVGVADFGNTTTFKFERAVALTETVTDTETHTETRSQSWTVNVPAKKMGQVEMLAFQTTIEIPFSATVVVDGPLEANKSGVSNASDLLPEAERTMPFEGTLTLSDVSDSTYTTTNFPGNPACAADEVGKVVSEGRQYTLPPGGKPSSTFKNAPHRVIAWVLLRNKCIVAVVAVVAAVGMWATLFALSTCPQHTTTSSL